MMMIVWNCLVLKKSIYVLVCHLNLKLLYKVSSSILFALYCLDVRKISLIIIIDYITNDVQYHIEIIYKTIHREF